MKIITMFLCFAFSQIVLSQQQVMIQKKCTFEGSETLPSRSYICERLFFEKEDLIYRIEYSYNGWQITDSITYERTNGKCIIKDYQAQYDFNNRVINHYLLLYVDSTLIKNSLNNELSKINDRFNLTKDYLDDLNFLLERNPINEADTFKFEDGIIPSAFIKYSIPYNEILYEFNYSVKDNLIKNDSFTFENFIVSRKYYYKDKMLQKVLIIVEDKRKAATSKFGEYFSSL